MRPFDAFGAFYYGQIHGLTYVREGEDIADCRNNLRSVRYLVDHFAAQVRHQKELPDAVDAARALMAYIEGTLLCLKDGERLKNAHVALLRDYLSEFELSASLNLGRLPIYLLENKRGYSPHDFLTSGARIILSERDREALPALCLSDIDEAGKCLLHEQYTACGFHILRAVESVARPFYQLVTGRPPINKKGEFFGLGLIADALKEKANDSLDSQLSIISKHRNAVMHPQNRLDEDDAIEMFDSAKVAISLMAREARSREARLNV